MPPAERHLASREPRPKDEADLHQGSKYMMLCGLGFRVGYIGIMENKMETAITYWGNVGAILG